MYLLVNIEDKLLYAEEQNVMENTNRPTTNAMYNLPSLSIFAKVDAHGQTHLPTFRYQGK